MAHPDRIDRRETLIGGKYRLGPEIGVGGVAKVYRATHVWTEREVAVKILDPTLPHFTRLREQFLQEARATVQLDHPNVVDVLDMGEDDEDTVFLVMEYIDGPTLRDLLSDGGPLSSDDALAILVPLIDALEKAHSLGIVHRDFKPENIMLSFDEDGEATPRLLDFGTAAVFRGAGMGTDSGDVIIGTPQYMSPEQASNDRAGTGPHTDVWGVGVVWYECLTGRCPFEGHNAEAVLHAVCHAPIDFTGIPDAFIPVLSDALHRAPELRIPTLERLRARIDEVYEAPVSRVSERVSTSSNAPRARETHPTLQGLGPGESVPPPPRPPPPPSRVELDMPALPSRSHRAAAWGGAALVVALALGAWWTVSEPEDNPRSPGEPVAVEREEVPTESPEPTVAVPSRVEEADVAEHPPVEVTPIPDEVAKELPEPAPAPTPEPRAKAVSKAAPPGPSPRVTPAPAAAKAKPRSTTRRRARRRPDPSPKRSPKTNDAPPLVTEW